MGGRLAGALVACALLGLADPALARTVLTGSAFGTGLTEPVWIAEHLLGLLALGLWAGQNGGAAVWQVTVAVLVAVLGAGLAEAAGLRLPRADLLLILSVLVAGLLVALNARPPLTVAVLSAALLAVPHGAVHEGSWLFWSGYAAGVLLVGCAGVGLAAVLFQGGGGRLIRMCGGAVAVLAVLQNLDRIAAALP